MVALRLHRKKEVHPQILAKMQFLETQLSKELKNNKWVEEKVHFDKAPDFYEIPSFSAGGIKESGKGVIFDPRSSKISYITGSVDLDYTKTVQLPLQDYLLYKMAFERVPKVSWAINTFADFAVQAGYKFKGSEEDVKVIEKWAKKNNLDNMLVMLAKETRLFGNVFMEVVGRGEDMELHALPVHYVFVRRDPYGKLLGYVQVTWEQGVWVLKVDQKNKPIEFAPDEMIHFAWNRLGTDAYGLSEIKCGLKILKDKLDVETVLSAIAKFMSEPIIIYHLGTEERPYNDAQINNWIGNILTRTIGSSMVTSGDVRVTSIQPNARSSDLDTLLKHIENQLDMCLGMPNLVFSDKGDSGTQDSMNKIDTLERRVKVWQNKIASIFEGQVFPLILGRETDVTIEFNEQSTEMSLRKARLLRQYVGDGKAPPIMTPNEARASLGLPEMDDDELLKWNKPQAPDFQDGQGGFPNGQRGDRKQPAPKKAGD